MRRTRTVLGAGLLVLATAGDFAVADTLSDLRWEKRILILFGAQEERVSRQAEELLRDEAGLADRDMLVFAVVADALRPIYGTIPAEETAAALREHFGVGADEAFAAILIGKDGQEKWRSAEPVPHAEIDAIIDAMPMRRSGD